MPRFWMIRPGPDGKYDFEAETPHGLAEVVLCRLWHDWYALPPGVGGTLELVAEDGYHVLCDITAPFADGGVHDVIGLCLEAYHEAGGILEQEAFDGIPF